MARTAADRPGESKQKQACDESGRSLAGRKRSSGTVQQEMSQKTSGMEEVVEVEPVAERASETAPKLSRENQDLLNLMRAYMDQKFDGLGAEIKGEVEKNTNGVVAITREVRSNRDDINKISDQVRQLSERDLCADESKIEGVVRKIVSERDAAGGTVGEEVRKIAEELETLKDRGGVDMAKNQENSQYWFARRVGRSRAACSRNLSTGSVFSLGRSSGSLRHAFLKGTLRTYGGSYPVLDQQEGAKTIY